MTEEKIEGKHNFAEDRGISMSICLAILSKEYLKHFQEDYQNDKKNLLAQSTCCQQPLADVIVDRQTRHSSVHVFNTKVDENSLELFGFSKTWIIRLDFIGRSTCNKSKSVRPLLDICLFECHANTIDENIENR